MRNRTVKSSELENSVRQMPKELLHKSSWELCTFHCSVCKQNLLKWPVYVKDGEEFDEGIRMGAKIEEAVHMHECSGSRISRADESSIKFSLDFLSVSLHFFV